MRHALAEGHCSAVGSAPYCDPKAQENIDIIFNLAKEFNVMVDFHLDYFLDGQQSHIAYVIEQTLAFHMHSKVCVGHMTNLSTVSRTELETIANGLKNADIAVVALPASDLCMMARNEETNKRRGVCPIQILASFGVKVCFATNNIQNPFTFTGDGDVLKIGTLLCQLLNMTSEKSAQSALDMATKTAASAIGKSILDWGTIAVGQSASFFLVYPPFRFASRNDKRREGREGGLHAVSALKLFAAPPNERIVLKNGVIVSVTAQTHAIASLK